MQLSFHRHILQFKQPAGTSRGVYRTRKVWYVIACDDDGNYGIGECAPLPDLSCDALPDAAYESVLHEACQRTQMSAMLPEDWLRPYPSIRFGLETALLSLKSCQKYGTPYHLFDTSFSRGEEGITINGLVWMGSYEEMMARMEEKLALGFRCIKLKIGAIDWNREIGLIRAIRERFPKEVVEIRVDANGGFSIEQAPERLRELARYDIHSIEQPIRQGQWDAMAELCRMTPVPIALDEELIGINDPAEKVRLLDTIRPQYIILKPSLHGGLAGCNEWVQMADQRGIGHWATSALESNVGLNAIAQWCSLSRPEMPSGLGTGQLFVENYDAIALSIRGERLWCGGDRDRDFRQDFHQLLQEWHDGSPELTVHTSGSTGIPQAIRVMKERMMASARMTLDFLQLRPGNTALLCMPLKYIAGKMMVVRSIVGNLRLIPVAPSAHPLRSLAQGWDHGVNIVPDFMALTPMQALNTLEDDKEREIFFRIPRVIIGGGAVTPELHAALQPCQGKVYSTYGMTETLSHIAMRQLNGSAQSDWYVPLPNVTVNKSADNCLIVNAPLISEEQIATHDICEINEDGSFRILGRKDNIICSGGIKLSLETLEQKLACMPVPFQFTAVPDRYLGEALTLLCECDEHAVDDVRNELTSLIETSQLTSYERPKHILFVSHLPMTETHKPARAAARQLAEELIKQHSSE